MFDAALVLLCMCPTPSMRLCVHTKAFSDTFLEHASLLLLLLVLMLLSLLLVLLLLLLLYCCKKHLREVSSLQLKLLYVIIVLLWCERPRLQFSSWQDISISYKVFVCCFLPLVWCPVVGYGERLWLLGQIAQLCNSSNIFRLGRECLLNTWAIPLVPYRVDTTPPVIKKVGACTFRDCRGRPVKCYVELWSMLG